MKDWTHSSYGTAETLRIGRFRLSVKEPMTAKGEPTRYEVYATMDAKARETYLSRDEAKAVAVRMLQQIIERAQAELSALESEL